MKVSISGIRGILGNDLTLKDILKFCNNFATVIKSNKCIIASDVRPTSHMIKNISSAALNKNGIDVYDLGIAPTPVVFRESSKYGSGIVVTASHNPILWNGLKFTICGRGINTNELESIFNTKSSYKNNIGKYSVAVSNYVNEVMKIIGNYNLGRKLVVDVGGGTVKNVVLHMLRRIGCKVYVINDGIGKLIHNIDPVVNSLTSLIQHTNKNDIGFAFDMDGDRLVIVKNKKKYAPDITLGLGIAKTMELGYKKFVISIDTSIGIEKYILDMGGKIYRSKVGEINVIEKIQDTKSHAGGEGSSGGFIFPEFNLCRDGILTSGLISSMEDDKIDKILDYMNKFHQIRYKFNIKSDFHNSILDNVFEKIKFHSQIDTLDGIKIMMDDYSWVLIRKSNTEEAIRISIESDTIEKVKSIKQKINSIICTSHEQIKRKRYNKDF